MEGIADYEFVRSLGPGHHGECFLAKRPERLPVDADYVAVKVFGSTGTEAFRRATRELKAVAAVQSPYLAVLYDAGQQAGTFYYAMEYLPGGSLRRPARELRRGESFVTLAQAARGAQALHDAGILHRDIRPGNVMILDEGGKLSDFGLAEALSPGTVTSVGFSDPLMIDGDQPGPPADVWSLGATLHWVVAGTGFYGELPDDDPLEAMRTVLGSTPTLADGLDDDVADLVRACIGEVSDRPTAGKVAERLEKLATAS